MCSYLEFMLTSVNIGHLSWLPFNRDVLIENGRTKKLETTPNMRRIYI